MGRIFGNDDDALKLPGAAIWRFRTWAESFGRTPKVPIGAADNPYFEDFRNRKEAPTAKTHQLLGAIREIRQSSLNADFSNKLNMSLRRRVLWAKMEDSFYAKRFSC